MAEISTAHRVYIGIGSNMDDPQRNVRTGIAALAQLGAVCTQSSLYHAKPWGVTDQPDYINAVVLLETQLEPHALLAELKGLETQLGRVPAKRWCPRVIDFDILTYDEIVLDETRAGRRLCIPHPHMRQRAFVLIPLAEIDMSFAAMRDILPDQELATVQPL